MNILFITSEKRDLVKVWVCQESTPAGSVLPPVDLCSLAASARQKGAQVKILDLRLSKNPKGALAETIASFEPCAVVMNISTTGAFWDLKLLASMPIPIKKFVFGTHAQTNPEECFAHGIDGVMLGDPEQVLQNLIDHQWEPRDTPGLILPSCLKPEPAYRDNLDSLPYPALDLIDLNQYHAPYIKGGERFTLMLSGRGCPFKCTYCLYPVLFGSKGRQRSVENILGEIEFNQKQFGINNFYFLDATFNLDVERIRSFCRAILAKDLKVTWLCNMRVAPVPNDMLALMKQAGCSWIFYGVEDQDLLSETKKATTANATLDAFTRTREAGIMTMAFTMVFPREDIGPRQYQAKVLAALANLGADAFQCNVAIPFPGTEMFKDFEKSYPNLSRDWRLYDPHGETLPYPTQYSLPAVKRAVYRNFFWQNPAKIWRVATRLDPRSLFFLGLAFIRKNFVRL